MAAGFTGCNNDIFVERIPDFNNSIELTVNKPCTVAIPFDGLQAVYVSCDGDYYTSIEYYDRYGNRLDDFPLISNVARVVYGSPRFMLEAFVNGGDITFCLVDNTYEKALPVSVVFDYGHTSACMDVSLSRASRSPPRFTTRWMMQRATPPNGIRMSRSLPIMVRPHSLWAIARMATIAQRY